MRHILIGLTLSLCLPMTGHAQPDRLEPIIDRLETVYNIDKLRRAKTVRLEEDLRLEYASHDYSAEFHDLTTQKRHHVLKLQEKAGASEYLTYIGNSNYHGRSIFEHGRSKFIDYGINNYEDQGESDFISEYGAAFRSWDTLIAYSLVEARDTAKHNGRDMWLGQWHDVVEFEFPSSPNLHVFIRQADGVISRMHRTILNGPTVNYTFNHHDKNNGVVFAREHSAYAGSERLYFSLNRDLKINARADRRAFDIEADIKQEPARLDNSKMTVESVGADNASSVHHVGQGGDYSTFVQTNLGLIAYGTSPGFQDRFDAYKETTGTNPDLAFAIVGDHHREAMAGASDAASSGATLLATPAAATRLREQLSQQLPDLKIDTVARSRDMGGVSILSVKTDHAENLLVAWSPDNKILMELGHYISPYENQAFYAKYTGVTLHNAISDLEDIQPNYLLAMSGRKKIPWTEFTKTVEAYDDTPCFRNREICK